MCLAEFRLLTYSPIFFFRFPRSVYLTTAHSSTDSSLLEENNSLKEQKSSLEVELQTVSIVLLQSLYKRILLPASDQRLTYTMQMKITNEELQSRINQATTG